MVFITVGMGGATGTNAAPLIAEVAKSMNILTIAVITKPFGFEGQERMEIAEKGVRKLSMHVDTIVAIPNERFLSTSAKALPLRGSFESVSDVLLSIIHGTAGLVNQPGMINVDFNDVRTVIGNSGMAMFGSGSATGIDRATRAAKRAMNSPLMEDFDLRNASSFLVSIAAGTDITLGEFAEIGETIEKFVSDISTIVIGTMILPENHKEIRVTVLAAGLSGAIVEVKDRETESKFNDIRLIAPADYDDQEIAEIIHHLSNVYKSVAGDELVVRGVRHLPPSEHKQTGTSVMRKSGER
jgi:cell division protein FtsZ